MATNLPFDCHYSDLWVRPQNWRSLTTQKSLKESWYIECKFHDPLFVEKYPKGFPYRMRLNKYRTLEERKAAINFLLAEIPKMLEVKGYNPITKEYMIKEPKPVIGSLHPKLYFSDALKIAYEKLTISYGTIREIRRIVVKVDESAKSQKIDFTISEIHSGHVRDLLDYLNLTPGEYNKYLTHLSIVLSELVEKRIIFHNPIRDIRKKKTIKKIRETLEVEELKKIFLILKNKYYTFYRYGNIFFHSGSRTAELFRVQKKDVNIRKQEYRITILKGSFQKEVVKVILPEAMMHWQELYDKCESENDYIFAKNLEPGTVAIQPYQITKRWKRLVKDPYGITADFYALKHLFLDELDRATDENSNLSKSMAQHTTGVTESVYLVGREKRKNEVLKGISLNIFD